MDWDQKKGTIQFDQSEQDLLGCGPSVPDSAYLGVCLAASEEISRLVDETDAMKVEDVDQVVLKGLTDRQMELSRAIADLNKLGNILEPELFAANNCFRNR